MRSVMRILCLVPLEVLNHDREIIDTVNIELSTYENPRKMNNLIAQYTFLPWFRKGMGNLISNTDNSTGRATINARVYLKTNLSSISNEIASKDIALTGPGDIASINPRMIIKTEPTNRTYNFEHNYLAGLVFNDPDFPWRYTPEKPSSPNKLRPWFFLMALKEDEFVFNSLNPERDVQSIKIIKPEPLNLQPIDAWAWAHVQVNQKLNSDTSDYDAVYEELKTLFEQKPDIAFSRIVCPRKLEKNTKYFTFLIPLFETGRKAGLNDESGASSATQFSWNPGDFNIDFPFYYQFEFTTSGKGDFENLARKLKAVRATDSLEMPTINIRSLKLALKDQGNSYDNVNDLLPFTGAYKVPHTNLQPWASAGNTEENDLKEKLRKRINENTITPLNENEDPIVNIPPMYGQWHAAANELPSSKPWLDRLNLDPRYRAIAALGGKVVRENQEKFIGEAWDQLGEITEANQKLRQAQFAIEVNKKTLEKHIMSRQDEDIIAQCEKVHKKIKHGGATIQNQIKNSLLTGAGVNSGLRKVLRKNGKTAKKINKQINAQGFLLGNNNLVANLNNLFKDKVTGAVKKPFPYEFTDPQGVSLDSSSITPISAEEDDFIISLESYSTNTSISSETPSDIIQLKNEIANKIHPLKSLGEKIMRIIPITSIPAFPGSAVDRIKPVLAYPELPYPMYEYLADLSSEFIIPGLSGVDDNSVMAMSPDLSFIEAFMAGLNHEMARELLWREYPTDQRGSYFQKFWNTDDYLDLANSNKEFKDINPIHEWVNGLGDNKHVDTITPKLVLVIRGELLKKFPNTMIYAHKAKINPDNSINIRVLDIEIPNNLKFPISKADIAPDITIVGFDISAEEAAGINGDPGWFFIFQERLGETRFGLDYDENITGPTTLSSWNDLAWQHMDVNNPNSIYSIGLDASALPNDNSAFPDNLSFPNGDTIINMDKNINYGTQGDAAQLAYILHQAPVMVGIHASDLLFLPDSSGNTTKSRGNSSQNSNYQNIG